MLLTGSIAVFKSVTATEAFCTIANLVTSTKEDVLKCFDALQGSLLFKSFETTFIR